MTPHLLAFQRKMSLLSSIHYFIMNFICTVLFNSLEYLVQCSRVVRPPDIVCRRTYILPMFLLLFFRRLISEIAERNWTKIGHMVGSKCNLKTHVRNLGYPLPLQIGGPKTTFFGRLRNLTATSTVYIFGMKDDIDNLSSALTTTRCLLHRPET